MMNEATRAIEAVWRIEAPRLIAGLARMLRDLGLAEEFAQDALVAALEHWPREGTPDNPGAWLMATAKRRAIDELRRRKLRSRKHEELGHIIGSSRETVTRLLSDFKRRRIVEVAGATILIRDRRALEALALAL